MKMETTITAPRDMKISRIALAEATMVETDDLVVEAE
jgi:biotin carboxyl carrier protein